MTFFRNKFPFSRPKFLMTFFLVIDQVFLIFLFVFQIFRVLNVVYDPFFTRKTTILESNSLMIPFFILFVLSCASDNTTSQNIGGDGCMGRPPLQILGDRPPSLPRSPPLPARTERCLEIPASPAPPLPTQLQ